MKRFKVLPMYGLLPLFLAACCPPALQASPTAFRAEVLGTTPAAGALQLQRGAGTPLLTLDVAGAKLETAEGQRLTLAAFGPGDSVYVVGTIRAEEVTAREVRRLGER